MSEVSEVSAVSVSPTRTSPALQDRLTRLSQASLSINESLDLDDVFRKVLDSARSLTGARYGVITTINDAGHNNAFLSSGTTPEEHRRLAEMPERHQLFGYLSRLSSPMRVDDFQSHTRSLGMPEFTPLLPVRAFLGAPIRYRGAGMGHIYLAKPDGAPEFTREDEETLAMFASQGGSKSLILSAGSEEGMSRGSGIGPGGFHRASRPC